MAAPYPVTLTGSLVELQPFSPRHIDDLFEAAREDEVWSFIPWAKAQSRDEMAKFVEESRARMATGTELPFAIIDQRTGKAVGQISYIDIAPEHRHVEIGTWLARSTWRTGINTECKYLMLRHAFEALECIRVQMKTDVRNERSQRAIERLGAIREGELRKEQILRTGFERSSFVYSIIDDEWPSVKQALEAKLEGEPVYQEGPADIGDSIAGVPASSHPHLQPVTLTGEEIELRPLRREDAPAIFAAVDDPAVFDYLPVHPFVGEAEAAAWIDAALTAQSAGSVLPFAIVERESGKIIGSTRYLDIAMEHRHIEIGWSWLSRSHWRTRANTESKYLLLRHAFETLACVRVQLKTDLRNERSQRAIERIGGVREAVLRKAVIVKDNYQRTSLYYSLLDDEWPSVKVRLESMLEAVKA